MREFINILNESVGLANRKPGDAFANDKGDLLTFVGLNFYPTEGKYVDIADMNAQISSIEKRTKTKIEFVNNTNAKMLSFGVVLFKNPNGGIRLFGRYYSTINQIFTGNYWPNNGIPDGFRYNSASATKMSSGLMPQDVLTKLEKQTPESILAQVITKFGKTHPLTSLTKSIVDGSPLPITIDISKYPDISFEGVRDYFCEILQPIAVLNGLTSGNADEAISIFFGKKKLKGVTITFSSGKNAGLYDSILVSPTGQQIKISTKGGIGAKASVVNLIEAVNDLRIAGNTDINEKYADTIKILHIVKGKGYIDAPLILAEQYGLISGKESDIVRSMRTSKNFKLTPNLKKLYDEKAAGKKVETTRIVPFYNMLAAIAFKVVNHVNEETDFSMAASEILNNSALVQIYTTASNPSPTKIILKQFRSVFPSNVFAGVLFSAKKNYFSTGNKGNFTFEVLTNGNTATPEPEDPSISLPVAAAKTKKKISDITTGHTSSKRPVGTPAAPRKKRATAVSPMRGSR